MFAWGMQNIFYGLYFVALKAFETQFLIQRTAEFQLVICSNNHRNEEKMVRGHQIKDSEY